MKKIKSLKGFGDSYFFDIKMVMRITKLSEQKPALVVVIKTKEILQYILQSKEGKKMYRSLCNAVQDNR